jgi:hypothetical protein
MIGALSASGGAVRRVARGQQDKGERRREGRFDCGLGTVVRADYGWPRGGTRSGPLDEQGGRVEGPEQGRRREKVALRAVVGPSQQAPQAGQTWRGREEPARTLRRVALREAARVTARGSPQMLPPRRGARLYLEVAGPLGLPREPQAGPDDQG